MADLVPNERYSRWVADYAARIRAKDTPPATLAEWTARRTELRARVAENLGAFPKPLPALKVEVVGKREHDGYRSESIVIETRPGTFATTTLYLPPIRGKTAAVLAVHGHWAWSRRDPVVQSRCIGLVKLGFVVLSIDCFGAGERYPTPGRGTYHGALLGSSMWPSGESLLGIQVYENMRMADYLLSRPECHGKLGITGASGGGNQTMYTAAMDDRFTAAVPVCSVGSYRAYLKTACCVCEVLPNALSYTDEGDILGMVAPRPLMVITASKDSAQYGPEAAKPTIERATAIYRAHNASKDFSHRIFESPHDYNRPMREAMYGFMALHLQGVGAGEPIPEPTLDILKPEELACYPDPAKRPKSFLFPHTFGALVGRTLLATAAPAAPGHKQMWEASAITLREAVKKHLHVAERAAKPETGIRGKLANRTVLTLEGEDGLPIPVVARFSAQPSKGPIVVVVSLDPEAAEKSAIVEKLVAAGREVLIPTLRATGILKPPGNAIAGAPDHNSTEHAVWVGRPMVGQWLDDLEQVRGWARREYPGRMVHLLGEGYGGIVAFLSAGLFVDGKTSVALRGCPTTWLTDEPPAAGTPMAALIHGILHYGDIPHLCSLVAPAPLTIVGGTTFSGRKRTQKELADDYAFTRGVYKTVGLADRLEVAETMSDDDVVKKIGG